MCIVCQLAQCHVQSREYNILGMLYYIYQVLWSLCDAANISLEHSFFPQVSPKPFTFTPFGNGVHVCLGRELAQLEMFIFLHHFTTNYR